MRRALLLAVVLVVFAAGTAQAEVWPSSAQTPQGTQPFDQRAEYSLGVAFAYYGTEPVCSAWNRVLTPELLTYDGQSIGGTISGPRWDGGHWTPCGIAVVETADFVQECLEVVHEVGHLTGLDHVDDPHNIMFASPLDRQTYMPGCYQPRRERREAARAARR